MKLKFVKIVLFVFALGGIIAFASFKLKKSDQATGPIEETVELHLNPEETFQKIDNFGASDAWSVQFVGKNWPIHKREQIADLLFSTQMDQEGNPKGIGLSLWRLNLGAGSAEQGKSSGIRDEWRRAESFLTENGAYDWTKQSGQVWFAKAAKERGVEQLLLFSNSPPVEFTNNGKAYTSNKKESNLPVTNTQAFAKYLADVTEGFDTMGLEVDYISPVNEPQWDWADGGQEGTPFWNDQIKDLVVALNQELKSRKLQHTLIDIPETAQLNYLFENGNKAGRADVIQTFFDENSSEYVGDLEYLSRSVSAHSYFTTSPFESLVKQRKTLFNAVNKIPDLHFWMSEYCILGDNAGEIEGNGRDLGMTSALYMAKVINTDLVVANASAWHWWTAISPYDYKDGLIYIDKNKNDGAVLESKMLWALGNYSRFIRPGYTRIRIEDLEANALDENFLYSAFRSPEKDKTVLVFVNDSNTNKAITLSNYTESYDAKSYVTSADANLELTPIQTKNGFEIPKKAVVTLVLETKN